LVVGLRPLAPSAESALALSLLLDVLPLVCVWLWLLSMVLERRLRLARSGVGAPAAAFCVALAVAVMLATYKRPAILVAAGWIADVLFLIFLINTCQAHRVRRLLLSALIASAIVVSLHGIHQRVIDLPAASDTFRQDPQRALEMLKLPLQAEDDLLGRIEANRVFSSFLLPNSLAGFLAMVFPVALGCCLGRRTGSWSRGLGLGLVLACVYLTRSKGGWLAFAVGLGVYVSAAFAHLLWRFRKEVVLVIAGLAVIGGLAQVWGIAPRAREYAGSFRVRAGYWRGAAQIFWRHPIVGVGPGNFLDYYSMYKRAEDEEARQAHNDYLQVAAEGGVLALAAYVWLWVSVFVHGARGGGTRDEGRRDWLVFAQRKGACPPLDGDAGTTGRGDAGTRGHGDEGRGDTGTRGHGDEGRGDAGTRGHGDAGTRGRGDTETRGRGTNDEARMTNDETRRTCSLQPVACSLTDAGTRGRGDTETRGRGTNDEARMTNDEARRTCSLQPVACSLTDAGTRGHGETAQIKDEGTGTPRAVLVAGVGASVLIFLAEFFFSGTFASGDGVWHWLWPAMLWLAWVAFFGVSVAGLTTGARTQRHVRLGIVAGLVAFLVHGVLDFDLYVRGIAQSVWVLAGLLLAARAAHRPVIERRIGHVASLGIILASVAVMMVLMAFGPGRLAEADALMAVVKEKGDSLSVEERVRHLRAAQRADPLNADIAAALSRELYGLWRAGRTASPQRLALLTRARTHAEHAIRLNPARAAFHANLAALYEAEAAMGAPGDLRRKALDELEEAERLFPSRPDLALQVARRYLQMGRKAKGLAKLRRALYLDEEGRQYHVRNRLSPADREWARQQVE